MSEVEQFKRIVNYDNMTPEELDVLKKKLLLRKKNISTKNIGPE